MPNQQPVPDFPLLAASPVAFPGFGPLMPWWDLSDGSAVIPMHFSEVVLGTDTGFPYRALAVSKNLMAIRMGRD